MGRVRVYGGALKPIRKRLLLGTQWTPKCTFSSEWGHRMWACAYVVLDHWGEVRVGPKHLTAWAFLPTLADTKMRLNYLAICHWCVRDGLYTKWQR